MRRYISLFAGFFFGHNKYFFWRHYFYNEQIFIVFELCRQWNHNNDDDDDDIHMKQKSFRSIQSKQMPKYSVESWHKYKVQIPIKSLIDCCWSSKGMYYEFLINFIRDSKRFLWKKICKFHDKTYDTCLNYELNWIEFYLLLMKNIHSKQSFFMCGNFL